ncbi:MAG TPA: T9SS type A sorting domain-containing protein, partial [Bacteroidia bacterium]|nr:T9SS type A sorting domain-containing protein [Bacteroidia bacterium]
PSMGKATLRLQVSHADEFEVYVRDVSGRQIIRKISLGRLAEGERDVDLDLSAMENGFYLIEVRSATGSSWQKLILQH